VLLYTTCTVGKTENQGVVEAFLGRDPRFSIDDIRPVLPAALRGEVSNEGWLQLLPHRDGTDGFFMCRMRRTSVSG
jgi:16S rRNA (cytosine967-C5)-methyltransferase